jgi:hypothetical protein
MGMLSSHLSCPVVSSLSSALSTKALAPGARADLPARSSSEPAREAVMGLVEGAVKSIGTCCAHRGPSGRYGACSSSIDTPSGCSARCCHCLTCSALAMACDARWRRRGGGVRAGPDLDEDDNKLADWVVIFCFFLLENRWNAYLRF